MSTGFTQSLKNSATHFYCSCFWDPTDIMATARNQRLMGFTHTDGNNGYSNRKLGTYWEASQQMLWKRSEKYPVNVSYYFWDRRSYHRKLSKCESMFVRGMPFAESLTLLLIRSHRRNFSQVLESEQLCSQEQWHVFIPWKIWTPFLVCWPLESSISVSG